MKILSRYLWDTCKKEINDVLYHYNPIIDFKQRPENKKYIPDFNELYAVQTFLKDSIILRIKEIEKDEVHIRLYPIEHMTHYELSPLQEKGGTRNSELQNWVWNELMNELNAEENILTDF